MIHPHKAIMQAWANNPHLKIEWRDMQGILPWSVCDHPSFSPELQYRVAQARDGGHVSLVRQFSNNPTLEFQKLGEDGLWFNIWSGMLLWGSEDKYRIKPEPEPAPIQVGDMMASKTTSLMVIVTETPTDADGVFSGVVVRSSALTITGQLENDWDIKSFTRVENTLENP